MLDDDNDDDGDDTYFSLETMPLLLWALQMSLFPLVDWVVALLMSHCI